MDRVEDSPPDFDIILNEATVNKRTFLNLLSATVASPVIAPLAAWTDQEKLTNWAGNLTYGTDRLQQAASVDQVRSLLRSLDKGKGLGPGPSFNSIADSRNNLLSLKPMPGIVSLDRNTHTVTVAAGITYGQLCPYLDSHGFALHNLASLPHISVAGACSTATHGSGDLNGNLATAVCSLDLVTANGELLRLEKGRDVQFSGAVVGLGAVGVVAAVALEVSPAREMSQTVYEGLSLAALEHHFDEVTSAAYSV